MTYLGYIIEFINQIFSNYYVLVGIEIIAFTTKLFILFSILKKYKKSNQLLYPTALLTTSISISMIISLAWLISLLGILQIISFNYVLKNILIGSAWSIYILYYQTLTLFLESIFKRNNINKIHKIIGLSSLLLSGILLWIQNLKLSTMITVGYVYLIIPMSLAIVIYELRKKNVPKILRKQVKTATYGILIPQLIFDFLQIYPINELMKSMGTNNYAMLGLSTSVTLALLLFCAKKMLSLRVLNINSAMQNNTALGFLDDFRDILKQLSLVNQLEELSYITKLFFEKSLRIKSKKVIVKTSLDDIEKILEDKDIEIIKDDPILIRDEIELNSFYNEDLNGAIKLEFLKKNESDIFCLLMDKENILGYIKVDQESYRNMHFSKLEHDQILLFCNYLSNVIIFLENKNLKDMLKNNKNLQDELHLKHQEINKYKESLRNIVKKTDRDKLGIIIYKNRKFLYANSNAQGMLNFNINQSEGHPISKKMKDLLKIVIQTNSIESSFTKDNQGESLKITAVPLIDANQIIFVIHYPEISDSIKKSLNQIQDPSDWDYTIYLETTESGKLINKIIPANSDTFFKFKIELLKIALSNKAVLLNSDYEDLDAICTIIKEISLKKELITIDAKQPEVNHEHFINLFGANPILGLKSDSLIKSLDKKGIILIKNIQNLSIETQEALSDYLKYGLFKIYRGTSSLSANTRILCTSNGNLDNLVNKGLFSLNLYNQIKEASLRMPSLKDLNENESLEITSEITEKFIKQDNLKTLLNLTDKEKHKLITEIPESLFEFKKKIASKIIQKSKKVNLEEEYEEEIIQLDDPDLIKAARMGKKALKEPEILAFLCHKFKSQNTIAKFLGVNRSSISRRIKEYGILVE